VHGTPLLNGANMPHDMPNVVYEVLDGHFQSTLFLIVSYNGRSSLISNERQE